MTANSFAFDDLSRPIIRAQSQIPSAPVTKPGQRLRHSPHAGPRLPTSAHSQRPTSEQRTTPARPRLRRHGPESAHNDDGGDDDDGKPSDEEPPYLPLLMRIEEVMRELSISRRTVYALIKEGKLHLVRISIRASRIRTEEVLRLAGVDSKPLRVARLRNQSEDEIAQQSP